MITKQFAKREIFIALKFFLSSFCLVPKNKKNKNTERNFVCCFIQVWNLISHSQPWAKAKGVTEQDTKKYTLT
jgi:hypothetical protein